MKDCDIPEGRIQDVLSINADFAVKNCNGVWAAPVWLAAKKWSVKATPEEWSTQGDTVSGTKAMLKIDVAKVIWIAIKNFLAK